MTDPFREIFLDEPDDDLYPGSKRKRREPKEGVRQDRPSDDWRTGEFAFKKNQGGKVVTYFTIGALAEALGVSVTTIRKWTRRGYIPQAPYRLPSNMVVRGETVAGRRLYTEQIIDATVEIFARYEVLGASRIVFDQHPGLSMDVIEAWSRIYQQARST